MNPTRYDSQSLKYQSYKSNIGGESKRTRKLEFEISV